MHMPNLFTEQIPLHVMCAPRDKNIRNYIGPQCLTVNKKQRSKNNTNQHTHTHTRTKADSYYV